VGHAERERGTSKYGVFKLLRLNFDLMTGFSNLPIHMVGGHGVAIALLGFFLGLFLFIRRIFVGPEVEGVFTLFAILFVFVGLNTLGLALIANMWAASTGRCAAAPASSSARLWGRSPEESLLSPAIKSGIMRGEKTRGLKAWLGGHGGPPHQKLSRWGGRPWPPPR